MEVGTVERVDIEQQMRSAYLSYAMSVITARALPDVRDGLKPVQRRILYAMWDMGLRHDRPTRKSARIVGEVLGKYHPHGDLAVYDAMVRMAQDFSMRYPLVEGQGNFGSIDGDGAAAIRYTEARLNQIGEELLGDLDKDTVEFGDNFDGSLREPLVLPAKLPNLLLNGVSGIAVGMATNIPPHNLGEICDAIAYLIDRYERIDDVSLDDLMRFIKGPDFPTGGSISGMEGIRQAYATGKGRVVVRAMAHVEEMRGGHSAIIVTEIPFQVNKSSLVERIATLAREGKVEGIGDLRDESDRTGMRIVIELKRGVEAAPLMEQLLKYTQLQSTFGVNMLALVDGEPRTLSLKRVLVYYIEHRYQVIERRTRYELDRALARAHVLEGLLIALDHLDEVIDTIRRSRTAETARDNLMQKFKLTEVQAQAILDLQLRRLAALERKKIQDEYEEVKARIAYLRDLLGDKAKLRALIRQDALEMKKTYGDARRTRINEEEANGEFRSADLLPDESKYALLTREGLVRCFPESAYASRRTTVPGMYARERDALQNVLVAHAQETAYFFSAKGRAVGVPVHQLPDATQQEGGLALAKLAHLEPDERAVALLGVAAEAEGLYLCLGTRQGKIKRLELDELLAVNQTPDVVIGLSEGDALGWALLAPAEAELVMVSRQGKAIRFAAETVRPQGRSAMGMRGISLADDDAIIAMDLVRPGDELVIVTAQGYAKRTSLDEYAPQGRGGQGALTVDSSKSEYTGPVVAACVMGEADELVLVSAKGAMTRWSLVDIPNLERASWGRLATRTGRNALVQVEGDPLESAVCLRGVRASEAHEETGPDSGAEGDPDGAETPGEMDATAERPKPSRSRAIRPDAPRAQPPADAPATKAPARGTRAKCAVPTSPKKAAAETPAASSESETAPAKPARARRTAAPKPAGEAQPVAKPAFEPAAAVEEPKTARSRRTSATTAPKPAAKAKPETKPAAPVEETKPARSRSKPTAKAQAGDGADALPKTESEEPKRARRATGTPVRRTTPRRGRTRSDDS